MAPPSKKTAATAQAPSSAPLWYGFADTLAAAATNAPNAAPTEPERSTPMAEPALYESSRSPRASRRPAVEFELPYEDDEPLAESDYQLEPLNYVYNGLSICLAHRADAAVHADMMVHYEAKGPEGKVLHRMVAPDVFVSFGVPKRQRLSYVVWAEGKAPDFVLEVLSQRTWRRDTGEKMDIYRCMAVREYWILDPRGRHLETPLMGYRLNGGVYERIAAESEREVPAGAESGPVYRSEVLGLELRMQQGKLRLRDPATGEDLKSPPEQDAARQRAEAEHEATKARLAIAAAARDRERSARESAEARAAQAEHRLAEIKAQSRGQSDGK